MFLLLFRWGVSLGLLVFLWTASFFLVRNSDLGRFQSENFDDLAALLFGASSIALVLVSLAVGAAALIGWQLIEKNLARTEKKTADLEVELRGRFMTSIGFFIGEKARDYSEYFIPTPKEGSVSMDRERMGEAFRLSQQGYDLLKKVDSPGAYLALNNLVFYGCMFGAGSRTDFLLANARRLLEAAQERDSPNLMLTACRALLQYGESREERRKAYNIVEELAGRDDLTAAEKKEAQLYLAELNPVRRRRVPRPGDPGEREVDQ